MSQTSIFLCQYIKPIQTVSLWTIQKLEEHLQQNLALERYSHYLVLNIF